MNKNVNKIISRIRNINIEMIVWPLGLILLFLMDPSSQHMSLCPLKNIGFEFCPGCGLGHSIHYIFHGEFTKSFEEHPLGGFALAMMLYRTYHLSHICLIDFSIKKHQL